MGAIVNSCSEPEIVDLTFRIVVFKRKQKGVPEAEFRVGKIPILIFWMLNSISLRFFRAHPIPGRFSRIWANLAQQRYFQLLTILLYLSLVYSNSKGHFSLFYPTPEKFRDTRFSLIFAILAHLRVKTAKMRLFDQNSFTYFNPLYCLFSPTFQAIKG